MSKRYGFAKHEGEETPETDAVAANATGVRLNLLTMKFFGKC